MHDYFGHGFHTISIIKKSESKILHQMGDSGTKSNQRGVHCLICVSLGVLDMKKFENHWATAHVVSNFINMG